MLKVHILTDDRVRKRGLLAEHGLSLWIEKDGKAILFDTGQSPVFCHNAKSMGIGLEIVYTRQPLEIDKGIMVSGEIPCSSTFEEVPKDFYVEKDGRMMHDMMLDEQMLIIEDDDEVAVFLGCSHPGVVNSLKYAQKLIPDKSIKLLVAGMHLENVSPIRLQMTIQYIMDMNIRRVVPLHCTGFGAMCEMKRFLGDRCLTLCAGDAIQI